MTKEMKKVYQALIVYEDGTKLRIGWKVIHTSVDSAMDAIRENIEFNKLEVREAGSSGLLVKVEGNLNSGIKGYEIRSRYVSPWEVVEELSVDEMA